VLENDPEKKDTIKEANKKRKPLIKKESNEIPVRYKAVPRLL
jgi:hypothetical protein